MKTLITCLLILSLTTPAFAYRGYRGPAYYPRYGYGCGGRSFGAGAGLGAGVVLVGVLAYILISKNIADSNQAELDMLDAAGRANQYENYLIALTFYNKNSKNPVTPFNREQWFQWRSVNGLEALR